MAKSFDFIIAGNNIGALVTAASLSDKYQIALLNPAPDWGAHFGSTILHGERYDIGMNFLEFSTFRDQSEDLSSYNPMVRNDCARFFKVIEHFIRNTIELNEIDTPRMFLNNDYLKDIIISNNLSDLLKLPAPVKLKMVNELELIVTSANPLHASQKTVNEKLFLETSYSQVSLANHGETFHNLFIEPTCQKICNISSEEIPALFHRVPWTPLFYPETLLAFLKNNPPPWSKTTFHYPKAGYFSSLTERLVERVEKKNNITILRSRISEIQTGKGFNLRPEEGEIIYSDKLVWAMDLARYIQASEKSESQPFDKTSIAIIFFEISSQDLKKNISTLYLPEKNQSVYRITNQTFCAGQNSSQTKIVAEINFNYHKQNHDDCSESGLIAYASEVLLNLGFIDQTGAIKAVSCKILHNAINLPTLKNFLKFQTMYNKVVDENQPGLLLLGPSSGFSSTSLNDQIVQGLKIAASFN